MKTLKYIKIFLLLSLFSCKTEQFIIDYKNYDILFMQFYETDVKSINNNFYQKNHILITGIDYSRDFNPRYKSQILLTKKKDTMKVTCQCPERYNYYFKNMKFKKGEYVLQYKTSFQGLFHEKNIFEIEGKNIETSKLIQGILFRNILISDSVTGYRRKDFLFKNLKFRVIDFSDTVNVKLTPIKKEKFWDNNFNPENSEK